MSMKAIGRRREKKSRSRSRGIPGPSRRKITANPVAVNSSTAGYRQEIAPPHPAHFPRSKRKLTMGIFSHARIWRPQPGQRDRGDTIDSPRGRRWITTFRKLPMQAPNMKAADAPATANPPDVPVI
jgi:hypothetical protein